jgi:hypothetical protein
MARVRSFLVGLACLVLSCGGGFPPISSARGAVDAALDCAERAITAPDLRSALLTCGSESIGIVHALCAESVLPKGALCDAVGGL